MFNLERNKKESIKRPGSRRERINSRSLNRINFAREHEKLTTERNIFAAGSVLLPTVAGIASMMGVELAELSDPTVQDVAQTYIKMCTGGGLVAGGVSGLAGIVKAVQLKRLERR